MSKRASDTDECLSNACLSLSLLDVDEKSTFRHFKKFQFRNIILEIGDYVLISNADAAEPATETGCDAARILDLYEDTTNDRDPFRAKVQWYSRPDHIPKSCFSNSTPIEFLDWEVLEDHRPYTDVSIERFFKKCSITLKYSKDTYEIYPGPYNYVCRYRLIAVPKRKFQIEPVLEEECKPLQLLTPRTPKTPQIPGTPGETLVRTPKRKIAPILHTRAHAVENVDEFLKDNRSLPGREHEFNEILSFVRTNVLDATSGCMYISGVPGTGKTLTVCTALKVLKEETDLPPFQLVEVNGLKIAKSRQAYVQIYKQLTGKSVPWAQACVLLDKIFTNPRPRRTPTVIHLDELDALFTRRRQDVLYSITEWAAHDSACLTVLAVANTMDLPEKALPLVARVVSRLRLTRLTFLPYTCSQLEAIVAARLAVANVTADTRQLIARKVAAVSGNVRRALSLCSRALELAGDGSAGLAQVEQALEEKATGVIVRAVRACSPAERLMLRAVAAEVERTGSDGTTLSRALASAAAIASLEGRPYRAATKIGPPTPSQALALCSSLAASRLLLLESRLADPKILLNIGVDDVHYGTRQINV